jgi:SAM-dependent methyltransferase
MAIPFIENMAHATGLRSWQIITLAILIIFCVNYLSMIYMQKLAKPRALTYEGSASTQEGFTNPTAADDSKLEWLDNSRLYDPFYASVYDQLVQGSPRNQAEVGLLISKWATKEKPIKTLTVLDVGCGTGIAALAFAKAGCQHVVAMDKSKAMIEYAEKTNTAKSILNSSQRDSITWHQEDALNPQANPQAMFDAACLLYFTVYYIRDLDKLFNNLNLWVRPGGHLAIQVVNKYKFDPLLDSASPFVFSVQKYSKERVTKSKVEFDKFNYEAEFNLDPDDDNQAEFRETFRFKDGSIRRQKHSFNMPPIPVIVNKAKAAGWAYQGFINEMHVGFEYSYLLMFTH